jgi:excisionase family DNA binding protein
MTIEVLVTLSNQQVEQIALRAAEIVSASQRPALAAWLDTPQAAKYLVATPDRIYDLVASGDLVPHRDGRRLLFERGDLDNYLAKGR